MGSTFCFISQLSPLHRLRATPTIEKLVIQGFGGLYHNYDWPGKIEFYSPRYGNWRENVSKDGFS